MSIISLKWFKDAIRNSVDRIVEKRVDMAVKELEQEKSGEVPYLNVKLVNDVLTVVLNNGDVISKINATSQDYHNVKNASSIEEIESIMTDIDVYEEKVKRELEFEKMKAFNDGFAALLETGDFELKEGSIYLKGINRSLPQLLVEEFVNLINFENNFMSIGLENHDEITNQTRDYFN